MAAIIDTVEGLRSIKGRLAEVERERREALGKTSLDDVGVDGKAIAPPAASSHQPTLGGIVNDTASIAARARQIKQDAASAAAAAAAERAKADAAPLPAARPGARPVAGEQKAWTGSSGALRLERCAP